MPETKAQRRPAAQKTATKRRPAAQKTAIKRRPAHKKTDANAIERTTEFSEEIFSSLEEGARTALDAVRTFVATVDEALPSRGEGASKREEITDSALEMAQRLVHTQYEFLRKVVDSAGKSLSKPDDAK